MNCRRFMVPFLRARGIGSGMRGVIMRDYEIPEEQWVQYFNGFSREHAGWPVTIEVLSNDTGPQRIASDLALQGISFDPAAGTRPCTIAVGAGDRPDANMSHTIDLPLHIREVADDQ